MKKRIFIVLTCGIVATGMIGCGSSEEETADSAAEAIEPLSSEEYQETANNYVYQVNLQSYNLACLGEYMIDDLAEGVSQDECLANAYQMLEENDGISEADINIATNTINSIYKLLQVPPEDYQEAFDDYIIPLHDSYEEYYSLIIDGPEGYDTLDDYADAFTYIANVFNDANNAYINYFSLGN